MILNSFGFDIFSLMSCCRCVTRGKGRAFFARDVGCCCRLARFESNGVAKLYVGSPGSGRVLSLPKSVLSGGAYKSPDSVYRRSSRLAAGAHLPTVDGQYESWNEIEIENINGCVTVRPPSAVQTASACSFKLHATERSVGVDLPPPPCCSRKMVRTNQRDGTRACT